MKGVGDPLDGVGDIIEGAGGSVESPNQDHDRDPEISVDAGDEETRGKDPASITRSDMDVELLERDETGEGAVDLEFQVSALDATPEQIVAMQQAGPSLKQIRDLLSGTVTYGRQRQQLAVPLPRWNAVSYLEATRCRSRWSTGV